MCFQIIIKYIWGRTVLSISKYIVANTMKFNPYIEFVSYLQLALIIWAAPWTVNSNFSVV